MKLEELVQNIMGNQNLKSELVKLKSFEEVYDFFRSNGYEGGEKELKENLFSKSAMSEEQLSSVSGGASGRQVLAACASFMMLMGVAPIGTSNTASAKVPFISNIIEKIKEKRHGAKVLKPTEKTPAEEKVPSSAWESFAKKKKDNPAITALRKMRGKKDLLVKILQDSSQNFSEGARTHLLNFFTTYEAELRTAALIDEELLRPRILIFNGESQQEKKEAAKILSQALTNNDPFEMSADDIEKEKFSQKNTGINKKSIQKQDNLSEVKSLSNYLKQNEGKVKVVLIDGLDSHPMDEMLRDILDRNLRDIITGKSIDTSGLIVICTTNETKASLQGRIKIKHDGKPVEVQRDKDGNDIYEENGDPVYGPPTKEGNKAIVEHDGSLMARLAGEIYYFDEN